MPLGLPPRSFVARGTLFGTRAVLMPSTSPTARVVFLVAGLAFFATAAEVFLAAHVAVFFEDVATLLTDFATAFAAPALFFVAFFATVFAFDTVFFTARRAMLSPWKQCVVGEYR